MIFASLEANSGGGWSLLLLTIFLFFLLLSGRSPYMTELLLIWTLSKEEGKNQESIQSSKTPDPGQHMGM